MCPLSKRTFPTPALAWFARASSSISSVISSPYAIPVGPTRRAKAARRCHHRSQGRARSPRVEVDHRESDCRSRAKPAARCQEAPLLAVHVLARAEQLGLLVGDDRGVGSAAASGDRRVGGSQRGCGVASADGVAQLVGGAAATSAPRRAGLAARRLLARRAARFLRRRRATSRRLGGRSEVGQLSHAVSSSRAPGST